MYDVTDFIAQVDQVTDVTWIERGGIIAVLAVALYFVVRAFVKGQIHSDREFQAMEEDRDLWRNIALTGATAAERATDLATKIAQGNPEVR